VKMATNATCDLLLRRAASRKTRVVAFELARNEPSLVFSELLRMASGDRRSFSRKYGYREQVIAIEALAETGLREALEYLKSLSASSTASTMSSVTINGQGIDPSYNEEVGCERVTFPNAEGELRDRLTYTVHLQSASSNGVFDRSAGEIENERKAAISAEPHATLLSAIERLSRRLSD
jgi:hypothetical protein